MLREVCSSIGTTAKTVSALANWGYVTSEISVATSLKEGEKSLIEAGYTSDEAEKIIKNISKEVNLDI